MLRLLAWIGLDRHQCKLLDELQRCSREDAEAMAQERENALRTLIRACHNIGIADWRIKAVLFRPIGRVEARASREAAS